MSYEIDGIRPTLVLAENPVEEPVVPEGPKVVTVAEFLVAAESTDVWYELTGTITSIANTTYGNFTIEDETGSVYVYGLTATKVSSNDKSFSSLGLKQWDVVTLIGTRSSYYDEPQVGGPAYYVSHVEGEAPAPEEGTYTLSFSDKANRTVFTNTQQVWEQNGIVFTNDKASSTNNIADYAAPVRLYQGSSITVEKAGMTKIEFTCNSASYATELKNSITSGNVSVSSSVVTVTFDDPVDSYNVAKLAKQVRMDSLTVYAE